MALPTSGPLSIGQIRTELGSSSGSLRTLSALAGFTSPDSISEFYGYGNGYFYPAVPFINGFDFSVSSKYSNSGSAIDDLSTYNWDGTFVTGTGNGTAATIDQYTATAPGYMTIPGDSPQKSIRLNDNMKFSGTAVHTMVVWFRVTSFTSSYPGIIGSEGRSSGGQPIGYSLYLDNTSTFNLNFTRYSGTSGTGQNIQLRFSSGGVPAFAYDTWYMASIRFDGSVMALSLHAGGNRYDVSASNSYSIATSTSWSAFLGLRYNNWLNGRIAYYCAYGSVLTTTMLDTIFTNTRGRYGV